MNCIECPDILAVAPSELRNCSPASRYTVEGRFFSRGGSPARVHGVTYGPFRPDEQGSPFPHPAVVGRDFARMREIGITTVRTYYVPPVWLADMAGEAGLALFVDVPWAKHTCFLENERSCRDARLAVRTAASAFAGHPALFALSIGNEIPTDVVRWHGERRVQRFLEELADTAKQADPEALVTFGSYPSTEFLDLSFLDFATFNVYLHDPEAFRRYLLRLLNLVGDVPLVIGELGMDTLRHGEEEQANFFTGHLRQALLTGAAGAFVYSWTDDWFTGGHQIEDWAFGITRADRSPKLSFHGVRDVFAARPRELLEETPKVSVVVCSYNGAATLRECLESLLALDYPDYEVILVDDGSTDNTPEIAARFPDVRTIRQSNDGLSAARNAGLAAATGQVVAYTDSDCFAHPDWLTLLVHQLWYSGAFGVGGPNLTPPDGRKAACVAACPGQPAHVLENDQTAEHIPGCNMAFYRDALLDIGGFNAKYVKAGDDVDLCWRLQDAGMWLTFAPAAFVWHHRRQTPVAYLRQQAGYGEAEGLLWFDHPARMNVRCESMWRGSVYGPAGRGLTVGRPIIFRGLFGRGLFQTLYQPRASTLLTLPSTLEWHVAAVVLIAGGLVSGRLAGVAAAMLLASALMAALQGLVATPPRHRRFSLSDRLVVAGLCFLQPLVRGWWRYRARIFPAVKLRSSGLQTSGTAFRLPLSGRRSVDLWDENWADRQALLQTVVGSLTAHGWTVKVDPGWSCHDIQVYCYLWAVLRITSVQEEHGGPKRLIRLRMSLLPSGYFTAIVAVCMFAFLAAGAVGAPSIAFSGAALAVAGLTAWMRGLALADRALTVVRAAAVSKGLLVVGETAVVEDCVPDVEPRQAA